MNKLAEVLRLCRIHKKTRSSIMTIAENLNRKIRGWIAYYTKFNGARLNKIFKLLHSHLIRWAKNRYKRFKSSKRRAFLWLCRVQDKFPQLFAHWTKGFGLNGGPRVLRAV